MSDETVWCWCFYTPEPEGSWIFPDDRHADVCGQSDDLIARRRMTAERCLSCGGTGDRFDRESGQWGEPGAVCPDCDGTGKGACGVGGKWVVSTCSCGFGGGDSDTEFDTMEEARHWVDYLEANSDCSVLAVTQPDGSRVPTRTTGCLMLFDWPNAERPT